MEQMEQIKIKMNEIEGVTLKIPLVFTGFSFNKFYEQLLLIGKSMPDIQLHSSFYNKKKAPLRVTPERFGLSNWQDKDEGLEVLKIWADEGKDAVVKWFQDKKQMTLTQDEISKLSLLMVSFRAKFDVQKQYGTKN